MAKYGHHIRNMVHWVGNNLSNVASAWWKDVCSIDIRDEGSWFGQNISRKIGNGLTTRFWYDCWMGSLPLCERFPRLFSISSHKEGTVGEYWEEKEMWHQGGWGWRRRLFVWEENLLNELIESFLTLSLSDEVDAWKWRLEDDGNFSVCSTYVLLGSIFSPALELGVHELRVLNNIWKSPTPSKVIAFSWKLLRNRIPTRVNLLYRGTDVNNEDVNCVHCQSGAESELHLFLFYDFAMRVWKGIFR
jgi:hypothetical protein